MDIFFKSPIEIEIRLDDEQSRQHHETNTVHGRLESLPVYRDGESVTGEVTVRTKEGRKVEHLGIKVRLLGLIETNIDGVHSSEFLSLATELAAPSQMTHPEKFPFEFRNIQKQYESYSGKNVILRYYVKVLVARKLSQEITREKDLWVFRYSKPPPLKLPSPVTLSSPLQPPSLLKQSPPQKQPSPQKQNPTQRQSSPGNENRSVAKPDTRVRIDVGIEECLHIEFEYQKSSFNLKDVIVGKIYFHVVRLKVKHMELQLIRREIVGQEPNQAIDSKTLVRFEIMDGAPVRGETIPIRLFLSGFDLVPTYVDVNKKFTVKTFLSVVLIDEDLRRYFKQAEIALFREEPEP